MKAESASLRNLWMVFACGSAFTVLARLVLPTF